MGAHLKKIGFDRDSWRERERERERERDQRNEEQERNFERGKEKVQSNEQQRGWDLRVLGWTFFKARFLGFGEYGLAYYFRELGTKA